MPGEKKKKKGKISLFPLQDRKHSCASLYFQYLMCKRWYLTNVNELSAPYFTAPWKWKDSYSLHQIPCILKLFQWNQNIWQVDKTPHAQS